MRIYEQALKLKAHGGKKRYIIALKYDGENEYGLFNC